LNNNNKLKPINQQVNHEVYMESIIHKTTTTVPSHKIALFTTFLPGLTTYLFCSFIISSSHSHSKSNRTWLIFILNILQYSSYVGTAKHQNRYQEKVSMFV